MQGSLRILKLEAVLERKVGGIDVVFQYPSLQFGGQFWVFREFLWERKLRELARLLREVKL